MTDATTAVYDADGIEVFGITGMDLETARILYAGRVRAPGCPHYMFKSERDAGLKTCERCPAPTTDEGADGDTAADLAGVLRLLADQHPDLPVHFQLPNGEDYVLDPENDAYTHHGIIVVPIRRTED